MSDRPLGMSPIEWWLRHLPGFIPVFTHKEKKHVALEALRTAGPDGLTRAQLRRLVEPSMSFEEELWASLEDQGATRSTERRKDAAGGIREQVVYRLDPQVGTQDDRPD